MLSKILLIQTASIGDVILATSLLEKLHFSYPEAKIDFLIKKGNEGLFTGHPFINNLILWNKETHKKRNLGWILHDIRKENFDAVINLQRFASTGILTAFSGSKIRIGFSKNPISLFFTTRVKHEIRDGVHEIDRNLELIRRLTDDKRIRPRLYPTNGDNKKFSNIRNDIFYTVSPGSLWFTKKFPQEKWIEFVRLIDKERFVFFLGSKGDHPVCEEIIRLSGHKNSVNMSGHLTLLESASLMKGARMNYTNDSAPMHLASAVDAPVTVVYCSTIPDFGFGPLSTNSNIVEVTEKLSCRPCGLHGRRSCPEKHFKCAFDIRTDQLTEHL
jgi:ADP-heptose:LPS heptosyltransferase